MAPKAPARERSPPLAISYYYHLEQALLPFSRFFRHPHCFNSKQLEEFKELGQVLVNTLFSSLLFVG